MEYVAIVTVAVLLQFQLFGWLVGSARGKYGVEAPAVAGNEIFERYFRVHMNTLEQLALLLPSMWIFAFAVSAPWAAALGGVFILGRTIYFLSYVRDPKSRSLGFAMTALPSTVMMIGILWQAIRMIVAEG